MRIVEQYIQGKTGRLERCEDDLILTEDFICVIDGVTSKSSFTQHGRTTGQLAVDLIKQAILQFPKDVECAEAIERLTVSIKTFYRDNQMVERCRAHPSERLAACAIIYSVFHHQVWIIGDCQCLVDNKLYTSPKLVDDVIAEARALYLATELDNGKTVDELIEHDTARAYVLPLIKRAMYYQNSDGDERYSFPVLDGFAVNVNQVKVIELDANVRHIVLASDGYPKLFNTLAESEQYLQQVLATDPLCYKQFKSTKGITKGNASFDDRTYVRVAFHE